MPTNSKELIEMEAYTDNCEVELDELMEDISSNKARDQFLAEFRYLVSEKDFAMSMRAYIWPRDMMTTISRACSKVSWLLLAKTKF